MPVVLIAPEAMREQDAPYKQMLRDAGFELAYPDNPHFARGILSESETIAQVAKCDALIASGELVSRAVFAACPRLRVVARCGVGYDRVDVSAATQHNVPVTITPSANHEAVAELALALLFAVTKSIPANDRNTRAGRWRTQLTQPVRGRTLGLVGLGRIGRSLLQRARALGLCVLVCEKYPDAQFVQEHKVELVSFHELLALSDFVSLHCPLNEETHELMNREAFERMKAGSVLINTARGGLVNEADLVAALTSGHLAAAGLDVYAQEPPPVDNPLFQLPQVVCTPHVGGIDTRSQLDMATEAATCIVRLFQGKWPEGAVVNDQLRDGWKWT